MEFENFDSSEVSLVWKPRYKGRSSLKKGEPSSASKTVKITHQQTCGLLLSNCYCLVFELLQSDLTSYFLQYLELENFDSNEISLVGKLRHEATSSLRKENPILPLRQSKSLINKHVDCYYLTVIVSFLNCYCLTYPQILTIIGVIELLFKRG
jgi:hypothetical protein